MINGYHQLIISESQLRTCRFLQEPFYALHSFPSLKYEYIIQNEHHRKKGNIKCSKNTPLSCSQFKNNEIKADVKNCKHKTEKTTQNPKSQHHYP